MTGQVDIFSFALVLRCVTAGQDKLEDALYEAGCDDGIVGLRSGAVYFKNQK